MKFPVVPASGVLLLASFVASAQFQIEALDDAGRISWSDGLSAGVSTVETAPTPFGPWTPQANYFTTNTVAEAHVPLAFSNTFCRLLAVDISTNSPALFTNLLESYGILETVAGKGDSNSDVSQWRPEYEGEWATNVNLSRPHVSFGDAEGNVFIVDQRSSSVLKVTPEGRLHTFAGTHVAGDNGDGPDQATNLQLNNPNGGWLGPNGVFYILDTDNGKVRRVEDGIMTTLFTTEPMGDGRAFWVKSDESVIYFGSGATEATTLNRWTPDGGLEVVRSDFQNMGNILGDERTGDLYISDREAYRVYRMDTNGNLTTIAGDGTATGSGGEGALAVETSLNLPRSVWFIPNGGFFIGEHSPGNRIWYVDPAGIIHRWLNGSSSNNRRVGDGEWFYENPGQAKVSRVRAVNTDPFGNMIITESNYGYVRRIRFLRLNP